MEKILSKVTPLNWALILLVVVFACMWVFMLQRSDTLQSQNNALQVIIDTSGDKIEDNKLYIDSVNVSIKKKELIIDSLNTLSGSSKTRVVTIYRDRDENISIIHSADRDSTRSIFARYITD